MIPGQSLTAEIVRSLPTGEMDSLAKSLGIFLSFLHGEDLPGDITELIPIGEKSLDAMIVRSQAQIEFINERAPHDHTESLQNDLEQYRGGLVQRWSVNHGDLSLSNIILSDGAPRFSIIDFTEAELSDPSMEFSILADDLREEGLDAKGIMGSILHNYDGADESLDRKMKFRELLSKIYILYARVRKEVRLSDSVRAA